MKSFVTIERLSLFLDYIKKLIPTVNNSEVTITQNGTSKGKITLNQASSSTIALTDTTYNAATQSTSGLMSSSDKTKLDGIAAGANNYSLPAATNSTLGGVKTGSNITNSSGTISLTKDNVTNALGYTPPTTDTTYGVVTTSANGLMSSGDKTKLDGIATEANKTTVDTALSSTSTNPVQNKIINDALAGKLSLSGGSVSGDVTFLKNLIGAKSTGTAASRIIILPQVLYSTIDETHTDSIYFKELLKWICANYPEKTNQTYIGTANPNSRGNVFVHIYGTSEVNEDGYPRYSSGLYVAYGGRLLTFGTQEYTYYFRESVFRGETVSTATQASQDSSGQQINTTYIKNLSASGQTITYTKGNGTTGTITTQGANTSYSDGVLYIG